MSYMLQPGHCSVSTCKKVHKRRL